MNLKVKEKLKIEKPEYYDATDSRVIILQDHKIHRISKTAFLDGLKIGSISGAFVFAASTTITLLSTKEFSYRLGIPPAIWEALFIVTTILAWTAFLGVSIWVLLNWRQRGYFGEFDTEKLFNEEHRISLTPTRKEQRIVLMPGREIAIRKNK